MEAVYYIVFQMTSDVVVEAVKILAAFFCIGYPLAQGLIIYSTNAALKDTDSRLQQLQVQIDNSAPHHADRSATFAANNKNAEAAGGSSTYLTNEQRALGKKLIDEAKKAIT